MKNDKYYVYCKGILGVKTELCDFKWVYGSIAPTSTEDDYDKCFIKFHVKIMPEKELPVCDSFDRKFQAYMWNDGQKMIFYRRTLFSVVQIGYNIRFNEKQIEVFVGKNYWKYVKKRIMNLHGMYFLLADIANMILLKNGLLTLYASAVYSSANNRSAVFFAPPNTGKTVTATGLHELSDYQMVGEDVLITDGKKLFSCPWTISYRKKKSNFDSVAAFQNGDVPMMQNVCEICGLTDIIVLENGERYISDDQNEVLRRVCILNGYLWGYYSTPIVKILGYFDEEYDNDWNIYGRNILNQMIDISRCHLIHAEDSILFSKLVRQRVFDEKL